LNYKEALRDINIEEYLKNHLTYVTSINWMFILKENLAEKK
jgi:hypothetical protein